MVAWDYLQPQSLEDVTAPCIQLQVVSIVMKIEIAILKVMLFLNCLCRHHNRESGCLKSFENTPSIINEANISSVGELICMDHN